jgi:hypothetical protein
MILQATNRREGGLTSCRGLNRKLRAFCLFVRGAAAGHNIVGLVEQYRPDTAWRTHTVPIEVGEWAAGVTDGGGRVG